MIGDPEDPYSVALFHACDPAELRNLEAAIAAGMDEQLIDNERARRLGRIAAERRRAIYRGEHEEEA